MPVSTYYMLLFVLSYAPIRLWYAADTVPIMILCLYDCITAPRTRLMILWLVLPCLCSNACIWSNRRAQNSTISPWRLVYLNLSRLIAACLAIPCLILYIYLVYLYSICLYIIYYIYLTIYSLSFCLWSWPLVRPCPIAYDLVTTLLVY